MEQETISVTIEVIRLFIKEAKILKFLPISVYHIAKALFSDNKVIKT